MNSFIGISNAHTTNLAVVAPGIAQALLATAIGLVAAIPAVVIYNVLTRQTAHYRALLGDASAQIDAAGQPRSRSRQAAARPGCRVVGEPMAIRLDHGADELAEVHDINVTPFIDVMLVLLIIFMVAAPLATVDVPVDLPSSNAQPQQRPNKPVYLTIKADHTLAIGDDPVTPGALAGRARCSARDPTRRSACSCAPTVRCRMATSCKCSTFCAGRATSKSPWSGWKRGVRNDRTRAALVRGRRSARSRALVRCRGRRRLRARRAYRRLPAVWQVPDAELGDDTPIISIELTAPEIDQQEQGEDRRTDAAEGNVATDAVIPEEKPPEKVEKDKPSPPHHGAHRGERAARRSVVAVASAQTPAAV